MTDLYAWLVKEDDGAEGIIGAAVPGIGKGFSPLVVTSRKIADLLEPFASAHGHASGKPVRLVRFTEVETLVKI
jgi:hypothetical protein